MYNSTLTITEKSSIIMDALSREDISPGLVELIQGWIASGGDDGDNVAVLEAIFDEMFAMHGGPAVGTRESLELLHERLHFPPSSAPSPRPAIRRRYLGRTMLRVAAVVFPLAILVGLGWLAYRPAERAASVAMMEVLPGEDGVITLPDGSIVRPVGDGRVTVAENFAENRHVTFSGEAFFQVARNEESPFTVETVGLTVTVLGTEFNLNAPSEGVETVVSLLSGSLRVESGTQTVTLAPLERLVYDRVSGSCVVSTFDEIEIENSRLGYVELGGISLREALDAVGDFYGKKMEFEGTLSEGLRVNIVLTRAARVDDVLEAIRLLGGEFDYEVGEDVVHIVGR